MQNRYVGDVGDFVKYGLLRHLATDMGLKVGVVWYLVPDESHNGDGQHVLYLLPKYQSTYESCDPDLYERLRRLVMTGDRSVAQVRARGVLPRGTVYFESLLLRGIVLREDWHQQALTSTAPCDLVFLDPDNGVGRNAGSVKHAMPSEVADYVSRGQSVVLYQHLSRYTSFDTAPSLAILGDAVPNLSVLTVQTRGGSQRAFIVIPAPGLGDAMRRTIESFAAGPWSRLVTLVDH